MQYTRVAMTIARGNSTRANILPMFLRSICCIVTALPVLWLGGCAGQLPTMQPMKRFTELVRGYDDTLTEKEKNAVISELQKDKERQQNQLEQGDGSLKTN
jgi:hypothetical protein